MTSLLPTPAPKTSKIWYPNQNSTWPLEKKQASTTRGSCPLNANDDSPNFCPLLRGEAPSALSPRGAGGKSPPSLWLSLASYLATKKAKKCWKLHNQKSATLFPTGFVYMLPTNTSYSYVRAGWAGPQHNNINSNLLTKWKRKRLRPPLQVN